MTYGKNLNFRSMKLFLTVLFFVASAFNLSGAPKFYNDDPIQKEVDTQDASGVQPWEINIIYDLAENTFTNPGDKTENVRAQNINTIDEVPDSSWFTNRAGKVQITPEMMAKGPNTLDGPAPGTWTIIAAKTDGVTPGFTIKDVTGQVWFIKFDPPGYMAMSTGTEVAATKLFWALGYNVPEDYIAQLRREDLVINEGANFTPPGRKKRPMNEEDLDDLMERAAKSADGTYRVHVSKAVPGKILGPFRPYGTRPDDPNDIYPHEHRRELRGGVTFAAWLNHVDVKSQQSLDTLITENGKSYVRHYLLDFSSTLGAGSTQPHEYWEGYENLLESGSQIGKGIIGSGFYILPWRTLPFYESSSVGRMQLDNTTWDPDSWKPRVLNSAFRRARADDKFWAARKVMAISNEAIRAAVESGEFPDKEAVDYLTIALIQRRDAIGRKYFTAINPIVDPALDSAGNLTFGNAAVSAGFSKAPEGYKATWYRFNNNSSESTQIGENGGIKEQIKAPAGLPTDSGVYVMVEISAISADHPSWQTPVTAYFTRVSDGWKLVGFERMK